MIKEMLEVIGRNPGQREGAETFSASELAAHLPLHLGGRTYAAQQRLNIATRLRVVFQTLEELGYLERCPGEDSRKAVYRMVDGAYDLLQGQVKVAEDGSNPSA